MTSPWIKHVKAYQKKHKCSYKEALVGAKSTYKKHSGEGFLNLLANTYKSAKFLKEHPGEKPEIFKISKPASGPGNPKTLFKNLWNN